MMPRFQYWESKQCVLLYCGDSAGASFVQKLPFNVGA
jgi:hypothetical protein